MSAVTAYVRPAILLVTLLLATGCVAGPAPSEPRRDPDPAASGVPRLTDGRTPPVLDWGPCADAPAPGFECAGLAVPRDYRDPASPTWTLAVSRMRATDPQQRRGVLLSNPGGPGAPGRWNTLGVDQLTDGRLRAHYDLIGLDVRGTGASTPAARCDLPSDPSPVAPLAPSDPSPVAPLAPFTPSPVAALAPFDLLTEATGDRTAVDFDADVAVSRAVASSCSRAAPEVLPYLGTVDVARDIDMLRAALGEARLSFSGVSYGTSLGTAYASMFPERTDRVLLDSVDDDTVGWRERFGRSNAAVDERFADIADEIAADSRWDLGSALDVRTRYLQLRERAVRGEVALAGTPLTPRGLRAVLDDAMRRGGEYTDDLANLLAFFGGVRGAPDEGALGARLGAGTMIVRPAEQAAVDQELAAGIAVVCIDSPWPRDLDVYRATFEADRAAYPISSGARATIDPCAFWPWEPREPLPRLSPAGHAGTPQALMLQHRADPATPLEGARRVREALGSRAVMITTDDGGHGVLGQNPCADDAVVDWFVDGELPERDTTC